MDDINVAKVEFIEEILKLMLYCGEGGTDNCDVGFNWNGYKIKFNITFEKPVKLEG